MRSEKSFCICKLEYLPVKGVVYMSFDIVIIIKAVVGEGCIIFCKTLVEATFGGVVTGTAATLLTKH